MALENVRRAQRNLRRRGIIVQLLPARTGVAAARHADVKPDGTVVVKLHEVLAPGGDSRGRGIVVQLLPSGTGIAAARGARVAPNEPSL